MKFFTYFISALEFRHDIFLVEPNSDVDMLLIHTLIKVFFFSDFREDSQQG